MTLQECYTLIGGDYDSVVHRMGGERLVLKFIIRFLEDKSFETLSNALAQKDYKEAFRAAHTLKGICQNLSFDLLYQSSNLLTEELRKEEFSLQIEPLFLKVKEDFETTQESILTLKKELTI